MNRNSGRAFFAGGVYDIEIGLLICHISKYLLAVFISIIVFFCWLKKSVNCKAKNYRYENKWSYIVSIFFKIWIKNKSKD